MLQNRLRNELEDINSLFDLEDFGDITKLEPLGKDLRTWLLQFRGRKNTIFFPGVYEVEMVIPETYPSNFPDCKFRHGFQHYHVYQGGAICLGLLKNGGWCANKSLIELSRTLVNMIHSDPTLHDQADNAMRDLYAKDNGKSYRELIQNQAERMKNVGKK